ncbi:MAG: fasciclin domain-containing protein [Hymenobacteraceae bacterium]|nr:fasciclin domain-containing protein [Hymenobacteraceae bacterium]MDX5397679.1 fasciclin domain-containing protein [Hymenobacteraceae bacterium]MDX5513755.1 fasciclin domain-containing protein [Hymenobacteraceae bacterium]
MRKLFTAIAVMGITVFASCNSTNTQEENVKTVASAPEEELRGQSGVEDNESQKNIVQVAASSQDHSTLVAAVKAAGLVDALVNAGPFTVFAPTNAAFEGLPKGTVENLLKPENKDQLKDILQYHVYVGGLNKDYLQDGQSLSQVNGKRVTVNVNGEDVSVNGAKVLATIPASNGFIYVVDKVLLPE